MQEFDIGAYIKDLVVMTDDEDYQNALKDSEITYLRYPNAYLARAHFWGVASSMENQMRFIGGSMIPNKKQKIIALSGNGFLREDDLRMYKFANETLPHINEERSRDDIVAEYEKQVEELEYSLRVAAIAFVVAVREHDAISNQQDQLTYGAIKARAEQRKQGFNNEQQFERVQTI